MKKMIDLGCGEAEYGSGYKVVSTPKVTLETGFMRDAQSGHRRNTPFRVGKTYQIFAVEVTPREQA